MRSGFPIPQILNDRSGERPERSLSLAFLPCRIREDPNFIITSLPLPLEVHLKRS